MVAGLVPDTRWPVGSAIVAAWRPSFQSSSLPTKAVNHHQVGKVRSHLLSQPLPQKKKTFFPSQFPEYRMTRIVKFSDLVDLNAMMVDGNMKRRNDLVAPSLLALVCHQITHMDSL